MLAYLQIFADQEEELNLLDDAARGRFLSALLAYATRGETPELTGDERFLWPSFRRAIDQAADKLAAQTANGNKGGRPKTQPKPNETQPKPNETQPKPNETQQNHYQEQEHIQEQEQDQEHNKCVCINTHARENFIPPTVDEVKAYAAAEGLALDDPKRFVDYNAMKGWKVGCTPMEDWKTALRSWCARERAAPQQRKSTASPPRPVKTVREQQYTQRDYNDEPGLPAWMQQRLEEEQACGKVTS